MLSKLFTQVLSSFKASAISCRQMGEIYESVERGDYDYLETQPPVTPPESLIMSAQPINAKQVWPLNWIPPPHLRLEKYDYSR